MNSTNPGRSDPEGLEQFGGLTNSQLAALLFELASQLHIERVRRMALEAALVARGIMTPEQIEAAAGEPALKSEFDSRADESIRKLLRALSESTDPRSPLRGEAPT